MSLFDFIFPEQAQAAHLRQLADSTLLANSQARLGRSRSEQTQASVDRRVKELEGEVGQLTIVIEALMETLSDRNILTREDIARKVGEIDARDGVIDGRITKKEEVSTTKKVSPKFNFPD